MADREEIVYKSKLAEQAERYSEMVEMMKLAVQINGVLNPEERNLFSVAFKNKIGSLRTSWRIVSSIELKEGNDATAGDAEPLAKQYRKCIEKELKDVCQDILDILDKHLIPQTSTENNASPETHEASVFYLKMKGDYCRYLAEFSTGDERKTAAENSLNAYKSATEISSTNLPVTHPIRLGLALNFSVFHYEILNSSERACRLAKEAFDNALSELNNVSDTDNYKDSTLILQLLRDNLTLWTCDMQEDANAKEEEAKVEGEAEATNE